MKFLGILTIFAQGVLGWWSIWAPDVLLAWDIPHVAHFLVLVAATRLALSKGEEDKKWSTFLALLPTGLCSCWWMWVGAGLAGGIIFFAGVVLWGVGTTLLLKAK